MLMEFGEMIQVPNGTLFRLDFFFNQRVIYIRKEEGEEEMAS